MSDATKVQVTSEEESRRLAEDSREKEWAGRTFLRELFLGNFLLPTHEATQGHGQLQLARTFSRWLGSYPATGGCSQCRTVVFIEVQGVR